MHTQSIDKCKDNTWYTKGISNNVRDEFWNKFEKDRNNERDRKHDETCKNSKHHTLFSTQIITKMIKH